MIPFQEEKFGRYTLVDRIAVGGMAEIFKAKTSGVGGFEKFVVVKRLHLRLCEDKDFINMLIDEAMISVQLDENNIAQVFDFDSIDGQFFIVMEYIQGKDLFRILKKCKDKKVVIPVEIAIFIVAEILNGLAYAHKKRDKFNQPMNIIHRDVTPHNILISWKGDVKLIDFGIAKAAARLSKTEVGIIKGKFYYMSPEQALGLEIDQRSDNFSAGIVLYEMLTNSLIYREEEDKFELLNKVRKAEIPSPSCFRKDISPRLEKITMKALARERQDRFRNSEEFRLALTEILYEQKEIQIREKVSDFIQTLFYDEIYPLPKLEEPRQMTRREFQLSETSLISSRHSIELSGQDIIKVEARDEVITNQDRNFNVSRPSQKKVTPQAMRAAEAKKPIIVDSPQESIYTEITEVDQKRAKNKKPKPAAQKPEAIHLSFYRFKKSLDRLTTFFKQYPVLLFLITAFVFLLVIAGILLVKL